MASEECTVAWEFGVETEHDSSSGNSLITASIEQRAKRFERSDSSGSEITLHPRRSKHPQPPYRANRNRPHPRPRPSPSVPVLILVFRTKQLTTANPPRFYLPYQIDDSRCPLLTSLSGKPPITEKSHIMFGRSVHRYARGEVKRLANRSAAATTGASVDRCHKV